MMRPASLVCSRRYGRGPRLSLSAFSLVELLVVIGILALLAAILLPVFFSAREKARMASCAANLRQIGNALQGYTQDYDGTYPPSVQGTFLNKQSQTKYPTVWCDLLLSYTHGRLPVCPDQVVPNDRKDEADKPYGCGYAYNQNLSEAIVPEQNQMYFGGLPENAVKTPPLLVAVFDSRFGDVASNVPNIESGGDSGNAPPGATRHQNGANYLFADGHVKWFVPAGLRTDEQGDGVHPGFGL